MIIYKVGDVLNSGEKLVIHGCNCFNRMGSGIAKQVREQCPNAYKADQETIPGDKSKLGLFTYGIEDNGMIVVNAYTQYEYGYRRDYFEYDKFFELMKGLCIYFSDIPVFAMPKIGSGLAGGDWNRIERILNKVNEEVSPTYRKTFHVYELK